ncbi:unnamed protein product, partial [Amoebophrya sp. A120]
VEVVDDFQVEQEEQHAEVFIESIADVNKRRLHLVGNRLQSVKAKLDRGGTNLE